MPGVKKHLHTFTTRKELTGMIDDYLEEFTDERSKWQP
jgi:hypothetical protein